MLNLRIAISLPLISVGKLLWSEPNQFKIGYKPANDFAQASENMAEPMGCERDGEDPDTAEWR